MPEYPMFAADGVEVTPEHVGWRVEFQAYEGYEGSRRLHGEGVIRRVDPQRREVCVAMPFSRDVYGRDGYLVGHDNLLLMSGQYEFEAPGKPAGIYLHYTSSGYQCDYPVVWEHIFRLLGPGQPDQQ